MFQLDHAGSLKVGVHAADNSIGSTIDGSSFSGLLTRVEIGHIRMGSAGNGRIKSSWPPFYRNKSASARSAFVHGTIRCYLTREIVSGETP
jgi:hypothetical protein